jgi:hypothetical protein
MDGLCCCASWYVREVDILESLLLRHHTIEKFKSINLDLTIYAILTVHTFYIFLMWDSIIFTLAHVYLR